MIRHLMRSPLWIAAAAAGLSLAPTVRAVTATGLSSFEGIEEPSVRYSPAKDTFVHDSFVNITEAGERTFRMELRYRSDEWDGDRDTHNNDRERAEVKGLGPHQKHGDTFEYATTWRSNPSFKGSPRFCHIFQLKATNGDSGAPLVTLSIHEGTQHAAVQYWPGKAKSSLTVREFEWSPGVWQTIRLRIKTSPTKDGEVLVSVNGDDFKGVTGVEVYRPEANDYRPKWGLYRGVTTGMSLGDDYIEHKDVSANKLAPGSSKESTALESKARELARADCAKALSWLEAQPASAERALAMASVITLEAERDPATAMSWTDKLSPQDGRADAIQRVFNRWSDADVDAALRWLREQKPSPDLDSLIWYLATDTTYRYVDRDKALLCTPKILDADLRARAIEHVVLIWAREDAKSAAQYVEQNPALAPEQKQTILKKLPKGRIAAQP